jgi:hypothetical protein
MRCINYEVCGNNSLRTTIHQFCKKCYDQWCSIYLSNGEE